MTRDGLVVENQADGTVENVSTREAEQDYSTDAEGKAEKILERAEDIKDGHKNKKKAKKAAETAATAESEDGLHRSASRLELTEEERADPELQPYIHKAGAKADKLDAARAALPKKRVPVKEKIYDAASGKAKSTLRFEQQDKGPPSLKPNPASRPQSSIFSIFLYLPVYIRQFNLCISIKLMLLPIGISFCNRSGPFILIIL